MKLTLKVMLIIILLSIHLVQAATLRGTIYNENLEPEKNVLVEVNSQPTQKFLSKDGVYILELPSGEYQITAKKDFLFAAEKVKIANEGKFLLDLFLLPDLREEDELWNESEVIYFEENFLSEMLPFQFKEYFLANWPYFLLGLIFLWAIYRIVRARIKYGPLSRFRKKIKEESQKSAEQVKEELNQELAQGDDHLKQALEIIKTHNGRIHQKELRREMLYLSEAKISLILTELEHQGKITKIKKGRGNVIILRKENEKEESKEFS